MPLSFPMTIQSVVTEVKEGSIPCCLMLLPPRYFIMKRDFLFALLHLSLGVWPWLWPPWRSDQAFCRILVETRSFSASVAYGSVQKSPQVQLVQWKMSLTDSHISSSNLNSSPNGIKLRAPGKAESQLA